MKFIDSQMHAFYPNTPARPWPEGATSPHGPAYTVEQAQAQMDAAGVRRAILVPPSWNGWDNEYSLAAAREQPDRFGVMGRFDVTAPDAKKKLTTWRDQRGMLGMVNDQAQPHAHHGPYSGQHRRVRAAAGPFPTPAPDH
jgi:predicted TIM-barrel fold metal-dependent hydrolase